MSSATAIMLERDNVNDDFVKLSCWTVANGERVESGAVIAEIETSKANVEVIAPSAGYLHWGYAKDDDVPLSEPIGHIHAGPIPAELLAAPTGRPLGTVTAPVVPAVTSSVNGNERLAVSHSTIATPSDGVVSVFTSSTGYTQTFSKRAEQLIQERGLSKEQFWGLPLVRASDILGVKSDPFATAPPRERKRKEAVCAPELTPGKPAQGLPRMATTEHPLSRMKRSEIQALTAGAAHSLPSGVSVTCPTRGLRAALTANPVVGGNVGALVTYEVARLLRKYPVFNATYRTDKMLQYDQVNIGYAMDDGRGLKVAVIQDCDQKSLTEIANELRELVLNYLEDKLTPSQISGGTFTITDLSGSGVSSFVPLISQDQGAILGMGGEQFFPGTQEGFYTLTLAFDHQLSEGRTAALFMSELKDRLLQYEKAASAAKDVSDPIHCARCGRGVDELPDAKSFMVQSAVPPGYLCNLCMAGF
jgi:pyruvate/2-oxoglutarate dehydrogenase complex dihydrolipoamide acyltransferase (E2) component